MAQVFIMQFLMNAISHFPWQHIYGHLRVSDVPDVCDYTTLHSLKKNVVCILNNELLFQSLKWIPPPQLQCITHLHLLTWALYFQLIKPVYLMTSVLVEEQHQQYVIHLFFLWNHFLALLLIMNCRWFFMVWVYKVTRKINCYYKTPPAEIWCIFASKLLKQQNTMVYAFMAITC